MTLEIHFLLRLMDFERNSLALSTSRSRCKSSVVVLYLLFGCCLYLLLSIARRIRIADAGAETFLDIASFCIIYWLEHNHH